MCFWKLGTTAPSYPCFLCTVKSLIISAMELRTLPAREVNPLPAKKNRAFPLLSLPSLPLEIITQLTSPLEIVKLATCNRRLEMFLRARKYKLHKFEVIISDVVLRILLRRSADTPDENNSEHDIFQIIRIDDVSRKKPDASLESGKKLGSLYNRFKCETEMFLDFEYFHPDERFGIQNLIASFFTFDSFEYILNSDTLQKESFHRLLNLILYTKFDGISIFGLGLFHSELLTEAMNRLPQASQFAVYSKIPIGFKHPNAFRISKTMYTYAQWLNIEDLFSIRNCSNVELKITNFDCHNLNRFLRYWVDCDEDMMDSITIRMKRGVFCDEDVLASGLISLAFINYDYPNLLIKAKNETNRKRVIGHFHMCDNGLVTFSTFCYDALYDLEVDLLRLLQRRKDVEDELLRIVDVTEESQMRIQELNLEQERLKRKFEEDNYSEGYTPRIL